MQKTNFIKSIFLVCIILFCQAFFIAAANPNTGKVVITQEIKASSKVQSVLAQTYNTTITGQIKNFTENDIQNLVITIRLETKTTHQMDTVQVIIASLPAGASKTINEIKSTNANFEIVKSYSADQGITLEKYEPTKSDTVIGIIIGVVGLVIIVAGIGGFLSFLLNSRKKRQTVVHYHNTNYVAPPVNPVNVIVQNTVNNNIPAEQKFEPVYCQYCGAKNTKQSAKCINCGGLLQ
jgi:hypothetical protein